MIVFPNCKINLGLHILRKRADGYHDLETVFYPVRFTDILELIPDRSTNDQPVTYSQSGLEIQGNPLDNLCVKAYQLLKKDYPALPPVKMHLHKVIPTGAGLGGGSADAAFSLQLLNDYFKLELSTDQLLHYALSLGSDCPFFILNKPAQPVSSWAEELVNDFEKPIFYQYPEIAAIKDELYRAGAVYASMSGSGSTVYGLFTDGKPLILNLPPDYFIKVLPA